MTIRLSPELEQSVRQLAQRDGLAVDDYVNRILREALGLNGAAADEPGAPPIWQVLSESMQDLPPEDLAALPTDGATNHDHYIYGLPKRTE